MDRLVVIGRGRVIADTSVDEPISAASGSRVMVRTKAVEAARQALSSVGAEVAATGPDVLMASGISAERMVALLSCPRARRNG